MKFLKNLCNSKKIVFQLEGRIEISELKDMEALDQSRRLKIKNTNYLPNLKIRLFKEISEKKAKMLADFTYEHVYNFHNTNLKFNNSLFVDHLYLKWHNLEKEDILNKNPKKIKLNPNFLLRYLVKYKIPELSKEENSINFVNDWETLLDD